MDKNYTGGNPGVAFAKCLAAHPGCKLISAHYIRLAPGGKDVWRLDYPAPSTSTPEPLPGEEREQVMMELPGSVGRRPQTE